MTEKKLTYQSEILALPPLNMVLGDIPEPDPDDRRRFYRAFNKDKSEAEARLLIKKLIKHLKSIDK